MIKKILSTGSNLLLNNIALLILRVATSAFMLTHGLPKLDKLLSENPTFPDPLGVGVLLSLGLVVFSEVICSLFLILGLATRIFTIPLIITMVVAVFMIHADDPFNKQEMGLLYLINYIIILVFGPGRFSIDKLIAN